MTEKQIDLCIFKNKVQVVLVLSFFLISASIVNCGAKSAHDGKMQATANNTAYITPNQITMTDVTSGLTEAGSGLSEDILSMGGGGMLFNPMISPYDPNLFIVSADMGGLYITHNAGEIWERKFFEIVVYTSCFDSAREGVIYAGGAGLYRSTDNGASFQMIFPNEDDVLEVHVNGEAFDIQFITQSQIYPYLPISSVIVNPDNSDNIFVAASYASECAVYESKDNGESFQLLGNYSKDKYNLGGPIYELTELFYAPESDSLYLGVEDGIFRLNRDKRNFDAVYYSDNGLVDVTTYREAGNTWFVYLQANDPHEKSNTGVYATKDFVRMTDLTNKITDELKTSFRTIDNPFSSEFKYDFNHVEANGLEQIFLSSVSQPESDAYQDNICSVLQYSGESNSTWLYGYPFKSSGSIENPGYWDDDTYAYGIAADWKVPGRFIETTLSGIVYSPDGKQVYQLTTNLSSQGLDDYYSSRGIDEHVVYKVIVDPFDEEHIMLLTADFGLQESIDRGETFRLCRKGIPQSWQNTAYDLAFNKNQQGVVYSIWSGNHSGSQNYIDRLSTLFGGFACSHDGGKSWDISYSEGLPETCLPVEMSLVYHDDSDEVTIYLATLMNGFFVSYDSGRTFEPINDGLKTINHRGKMGEAHSCIPASDIVTGDGRVFGIIQSVPISDSSSEPGGVYELIDGTWQEIDVRSSESGQYAVIPKDINYYDGTLYINYFSYSFYLNPELDSYPTNHGGGVISWDGNSFTQIFDESVSTTGFQMSTDGTCYISDTNGNIYRKIPDANWELLYRHFHFISAELQLYEDHTLFLTTYGGGVLRLTGLE